MTRPGSYVVSLAVGFRVTTLYGDEIAEKVGGYFWVEDTRGDNAFIIGPSVESRHAEILTGPLVLAGELTHADVIALGPELERIRLALIGLGHIDDTARAVVTIAVLIF